MKFKNKLKIISVLTFILVFVTSGMLQVLAASKSELKKEQNKINEKIEQKNEQIENVQAQMSKNLEEIKKINAEIEEIESEIFQLNNQISELNSKIEETTKKIKEQEDKLKEHQELLDKRLVALYESGTTSYVDMLLSSDGLADFISKYFLISELAEYDTDLINGIEEIKKSIEDEKSGLEQNKAEVENAKNEQELKSGSLELTKKEKNKKVNALSAEEKELENEIEQFEKDKKDIQDKIAKIMAEEAAAKKQNSSSSSSSSSNSYNTGNPSSSGYISPLPGRTKANITTGWLGYSGHKGVDFACSAGTPIVAVKSGTVAISTALKNSNGTYRSYGEYIVINHHDGTVTLYAHGYPGSRKVKEGDKVSQGQQIMSVGTTGNSTGNHLHFEVWLNGVKVNPTKYLP